MTIKITGISRLHREPNSKGVQHLAHFNASLGDIIHLEQVLLVDTPSGRSIWMVKPDKPGGVGGIKFGKSLRKVLIQAATEALERLDSGPEVEVPALSAAVELVRQIEERDAA